MVEVAVESADVFELVCGHDGSVDGVTRGNRWVFVDELFGIVHDGACASGSRPVVPQANGAAPDNGE